MKANKCLFQYFGFALVFHFFHQILSYFLNLIGNIDATNFEYNMNGNWSWFH